MPFPIITERIVIGMFYERLQQNTASSFIDAIATTPFDSDQDSENYAWLGMVPQMTAKRGEKKFSQLRTTEWEVKNVEYQGGIALPKSISFTTKLPRCRPVSMNWRIEPLPTGGV